MNLSSAFRDGKRLAYLGLAFIIAPPAILFAIFGNGEIPASVFRLDILTPLFILAGIALVAVGISTTRPDALDPITEKLHLNNPAMNVLVKRSNNWIIWFVLTAIWIPDTIFSWQAQNSAIDAEFVHIVAWTMPALLIVVALFARLVKKAPWYVILIGDLNLNPKDEREAAILSKAGLYTLALSFILVTGTLELFLLAPTASSIAYLNLLLVYWFLIRGIYGFIAWRLGLK